MDEVAALVGDVLVKQAVLLHRFPVIPGPGLHAVQALLDFCQLFLGLLQPMGGVGCFAVVRHIEVGHGVFQAQGGFRGGGDGLGRFHGVLK